MKTFIFLLSILSLFGDAEDYFKKITDKSDTQLHTMRNIDFIYMINLDQRPEKFQESVNQLRPYEIFPYRFSAVNGWELSLDVINDVGVKFGPWMNGEHLATSFLPENNGEATHEWIAEPGRTYFCHCSARGTIGISLSHLSILQDAYDSGYETIWVMEDDIDVIQDPRGLPDLIDELDNLVGKENWDILFTDRDTKNDQGESVPCASFAWRPNFTPQDQNRFAIKEDINKTFRKIGSRYGAYSMIIRRTGMKKILDFIRHYQIFLPFDMDFTQPNDIHFFTVREDVVSTTFKGRVSDNGQANYLKKND